MRFSVTIFLTDQTIGPVEVAKEVEARGFDALYLPEHTHIPASRATPAPMGEPLPGYYSRCVDPFVAFGAMGAATTTLRLGTGVCLLAQRDPIVTAKEISTLDLVAPGRFTFGVGFGWNAEEAADHGVDWPNRRDLVREKLLVMRELWTSDEAEFSGTYVTLPPAWQWPKPSAPPPLWLGVGPGPRNFRLVAELADGWIPIGGRGMAAALPDLRRAFDDVGRDMSGFDIVPFGSSPDPGKFEYFQSLGVTEVVAYAPSATRDEVLPFLDHYAGIVERFGRSTP
jgi:probable F420-dependent oxidoreductase